MSTETIKEQKEIYSNVDNSVQVIVQNESNINDSIHTDNLHNNDSKVLALLGQETGSSYSFKGLMRKLNLHQQSLTRALHRLEYSGLVEKSSVGYKLSKNLEVPQIKNDSESISNFKLRKKNIRLLQTYIPININLLEIINSLIGKWFDNFRWSNLIKLDTRYILQWISEDNLFYINLSIASDYIIIETDAISDYEKVQAMYCSYKILYQISKSFQNKLRMTDICMSQHIMNQTTNTTNINN